MKSEIFKLIGVWVSIPLIVVIIQAFMNRLFKRQKPQLLAMAAIVCGYFPFLSILILISPFEQKSFSLYVYMFLLYCFTAYTYFHVFNMSETSRRVRMLRMIGTHGSRQIHQLEELYDGEEMVRVRIDRLVGLGQLTIHDGILFPKGRVFHFLGRIVYAMSCLVGKPWTAIEKFDAHRMNLKRNQIL